MSGHALHENTLQRLRRRCIGQQPETKSARGSANKPLTNRLTNGYQALAFLLHRTCRVQNPDIPRAVRIEHTKGQRGRAGQDGTATEQFARERSVPRTLQGNEDTSHVS